MSLLDAMMDEFILMEKKREPDGEGGFITEWKESEVKLKAALVNDMSMAARVGNKEGVTSTYTLTTSRGNALDFHDVIKRVKDGATFRITSDANDKMSPEFSSLDMAQATAERWELTQ